MDTIKNEGHLVDEEDKMMGDRFPGVEWYCDSCNEYLNNQAGFDDHKYIWQCTECGYKNSISSTNIFEVED